MRCTVTDQQTVFHIVIIPYYSQQEIDRYLKIAVRLKAYSTQNCAYQFLLASSPRIQPSQQLHDAYAAIAPVTTLRCPTRLIGYPIGPTAMFWDCMDHIASTFEPDGGFSLWFESDMIPVKKDWLDRLSAQWCSGDEPPRIMGCFVSAILSASRRIVVDEHINGGACYAKDFAHLPLDARSSSCFDCGLYECVHRLGGVLPTRQIAFSTMARLEQDIGDPEVTVLHGYTDDKDAFINRCLAMEAADSPGGLRHDRYWRAARNTYRRLRLRLPMKSKRLVLESILLERDLRRPAA